MAADDGFQRFMRAVLASASAKPSKKVGQHICDGFFDAYLEGEITFEQLCCRVNGVLAIQDVDEEQRDGIMGTLVRGALKGDPPKRQRGNPGQPKFIRRFSVRLIEKVCKGNALAVNCTGLRLRDGRRLESAFEWVAKYWKQNGVRGITPLAVEKWYSSRSRATKKK